MYIHNSLAEMLPPVHTVHASCPFAVFQLRSPCPQIVGAAWITLVCAHWPHIAWASSMAVQPDLMCV